MPFKLTNKTVVHETRLTSLRSTELRYGLKSQLPSWFQQFLIDTGWWQQETDRGLPLEITRQRLNDETYRSRESSKVCDMFLPDALTPCSWYFYCCFRPRCHSWCMTVMLIGKDSQMTSWVPVIWRWLWYPFIKLISLSLRFLCTTPVYVVAYIINQPETPVSCLWFFLGLASQRSPEDIRN